MLYLIVIICYVLYQGSFAYIVSTGLWAPKALRCTCIELNWYYRTDCYLSLLIYGYIVTGTFDSDLIIVDTDILFYYYYY